MLQEELWLHSRVHIRRDRMLSCPKCPFVTEFKHHLEYHLRNHVGSKPFRCTRCNYACVNRSMLNSHAKSHTNVYQYRCADCVYATKYCHSLKLHLRKHAHRPAAVLNSDGSLPTDGSGDFDRVSRRGPPRGPRTAPPPLLSRQKLPFAGVTDGIKRAWSAEAEIGASVATSETSRLLSADWPLKQLPVTAAEVTSLTSRDPYAFTVEDENESVTWRRDDAKRRELSSTCDDSDGAQRADDGVVSIDDERHLPVRKRLRNAEFIARLTANIEAELDAEDRPLDLTAKPTAAALPPSQAGKTTEDAVAAQKDNCSVMTSKISVDAQQLVDDSSVSGSPASSHSSDASRGARRRKGVAQRRVDVIVNGSDETTDLLATPWSPSCIPGPRTPEAAGRPPSPRRDKRGFVECRHCRIGFRDRVTYALHMGYHGYDAPFSCNMCGHRSADRVEFFVHIATAAH